jgi:hypothetical protein
MKNISFLSLSLAVCLACSPASDNNNGGSGGSSSGGSGGATGGRGGSGGSTGGSTGGSSAGSGGSTAGSGGSGGSTGGAGGSTGGSGGSGGSTGGSGGSTGGTGGGSGDAGKPEGGGMEMGGGGSAGGPAAALNFVFDVPCPMGTVRAAGNCAVGGSGENDPLRVKTVTKTFGGNPATTYTVKLKICAVSEQRSFTGCMTSMAGSNFVCMDGAIGGPATYPAVSMTVSEPMHKYYLNNGGTRDDLRLMEYSATFEMKGGSTITFNTNGGSNSDVYTAKWRGHNYTCAGAPGIMQPFEGQFFWFTVESVTPAM